MGAAAEPLLCKSWTCLTAIAAMWMELLERYEPPPLEDDRREELEAFVARRTEEIGDDEM
jgi:trimethylamine:corrinoid methyltransferase-like protein